MESRKIKILTIDDNQDNLTILKTLILETFPDACVLSALNGQKGLELAISEEPDIILLDIIMPEMDGYEVCRRLKNDTALCDIPVVFVTAIRSNKDSRIKALECGAEAFLTKPIDDIELTAQIRAMLKIRAANIQKRDEKKMLADLVDERTKELKAAIGELKTANHELRESEEKFRYLFENSAVGSSFTQSTGEVSFNNTLCRMLGYTAEEMKEKKWWEITHPDDIEFSELKVSELIAAKCKDLRFIKRYIRKDGAIIWADVISTVRWDKDGNFMYFMTFVIDITDKIEAQKALQQSEERFQLLFDKAPLGYQSLDDNGNFIEVNQQWLDTLGYSREEVIGKWFGDFLCPEYVDGFRKRFLIFKAQGFIHSEFEMQTKNGRRVFISFEGRVGYNAGGNFVQTHCILQDITNQKKAEAALKESEFVERLLLEHLQVAIVVHNTDSSISFCNPLAEQILGLSKNQMQNRLVTDKAWHFCNLSGEPLPLDAYPFSLVYQNDVELVDYEMGIVCEGGGDTRWINVNGFNIKDAEGNILKVLISFVDTTEKKEAEKALIESEERYKYLFEHSGVGIGYYSTDGTVISYNQKALENIGGELEDYVGKSIRMLFPNEEAEIYYARIEQAISSDKPQEYLDHLVLNSEQKWFSSVFTRVTGASGQIIGVQIASLDVTDRKHAEQVAVENAVKFKTLFDEISTGAAIYEVINDGEHGEDYIIKGFNKTALKGEGKELAAVLGKSLYDLRPNIDQYGLIPVFRNVWKTGVPEFFPAKKYIDEKISSWYENRVYKLTSGEIVALFDDVTERMHAKEDIEYLAYHDYLTDAYNRRYFENEFAAKNTKDFYPLAIIAGDLNGLKLINDSFGHFSGDLAIQQFAIEIRNQIPRDAILARIGGDEFAVLLTCSSEASAKKLAILLQSNIRIIVKDNNGNKVDAELTATFGYGVQSYPGQCLDDLVKEFETFMNRRKFLESASKRSNVVDAIMSTLFEKSEREQQHSIRVSAIAAAIARAMCLDDATVAKARVAGALHDIGKIGIDESILNKADHLNDQERELIKQHPIRSARILASVDEYLDIVPIVKAHHERMDGSGYPAGLNDKQIPIEAKIIAVADSFDAMTVNRPYREAISKKLAADELKRCSGSQFDPQIVEIFISQVMPHLERGTTVV